MPLRATSSFVRTIRSEIDDRVCRCYCLRQRSVVDAITRSPALPTYFLTHGFNQLVIALHCTQVPSHTENDSVLSSRMAVPIQNLSNKPANLLMACSSLEMALCTEGGPAKNSATYLIILYHIFSFSTSCGLPDTLPRHK